jgi:diacylglycerol kinase family enzyme
MDRVQRGRAGEILSALRPAAPGLAVGVSALVLAVVSLMVALFHHPLDLLASLAGLVIAAPLAITATWSGGLLRRITLLAAILAASVSATLLLLRGRPVPSVLAVILLLVSVWVGRHAVESAVRRPPIMHVSGMPVGPAAHPVLFANPRSGGGKAARFALAEEAARRGIEYVIIGPGDDLRRLAEEAADRGADALGVAGGYGSQAAAAQVAMERDLAFVCVPSGTRNHFARDLGLDPADPIAALGAFGQAAERRIDLGIAGDRVFVNNVSLGVYALLVGTAGYRESKALTAAHVLPAVLGPDAEPVDLLFAGPDGQEEASYQLILISNGPYDFTADPRFGSRAGMDIGVLGIVAAKTGEGGDFLEFVEAWWTGQTGPSGGWLQWQAPAFEVRSSGSIPAGVDGEGLVFDAPLRLRCLPRALRVRVPLGTSRLPDQRATPSPA